MAASLSGQSLSGVPICAQNCLANATAAQGSCSNLDVHCLCTNENYVNALSCCLASNCSSADQQKAIEFDVQTCGSVNASAPNFVGCSPQGVNGTSAVSYPSSATSSSAPTSTSSSNSLISTVTGLEPALTSLIGTEPSVAKYTGAPLMTGTCTMPYIAEFTDVEGRFTEYPYVGCSPNHQGCCPFDSHQNAVISNCPQDYFTTGDACCPTGWSIYGSALGGQTPCYSVPSTTYVPAMTSTISGITIITGKVFTRKYDLVPPKTGLSTGAKAGIAIGAVAGALALFTALLFSVLRKRRARREREKATTAARGLVTEEKGVSGTPVSGAQELPSPNSQPASPSTVHTSWTSPPAPPGYIFPFAEASRLPTPQPVGRPASELPGSTFIHEHHPAFSVEAARPRPHGTPKPNSPSNSVTSPGAVSSLSGEGRA